MFDIDINSYYRVIKIHLLKLMIGCYPLGSYKRKIQQGNEKYRWIEIIGYEFIEDSSFEGKSMQLKLSE